MKSLFTSPLAAMLLATSLLAACSGGSSTPAPATTPPPVVQSIPAATLRMHFHRIQKDEAKWGAYAFEGPATPSKVWIVDRFLFTSSDSFGGYVDIKLDTSKPTIKFLVTDGDGNKNCGNDQAFTLNTNIATVGQEVWMLEGSCDVSKTVLPITLANFKDAKAHWLNKNTLAWPSAPATGSYKLYYAANGNIAVDANGVFSGADGSYTVTPDGNGLPAALQSKFPHLKSATALKLADADAANAAARLSGQVVLAQFDGAGKLVQATSLQTASVIDDVYAANAVNTPLGISFDSNNVPSFRLWAPTAKSVKLNVYPDATSANKTTFDMVPDAASGVWRYTAANSAYTNSAYYTFSVNVFSRWADNKVITNEITDPYSLSVNANSLRSFVANLNSADLKPSNWDGHSIPALASPSDIALYELHIRDFSAQDNTVPAANRGKYLAFSETGSNGMQHLKRLQQAGLTHIHLLPAFDIATVDETNCIKPVIPAAAADSDQQQAAIGKVADQDCFNWGYDPFHYSSPEGSYASNANDGKLRVKEFRQMVQSLHQNGLRVAMDVVYNHTTAAKQNDKSVLDKIVPGYYYRLGPLGDINTESCCTDTASENVMMEKLVIDSINVWARDYQVDAFRFDLMSFLPLTTINKIKASASQVAGHPIYIYGEAWNFGSIGNDARFVQARQANMAGNGIGSFNDRLRDAVRGGGCCDDGAHTLSNQGFINGAFLDKNATGNQSAADLAHLADLVRVGLSGTLANYRFINQNGDLKKSSEIDYSGQPAGYNQDPFETINYVEAHDNQTLFDINAWKLPQGTTAAERVRVQNLGTAIVSLAQGVPFYHAGQEILRSKSLDSDSYNSGDWFNLLDFSYQTNNFGIGLPAAARNQGNWDLMRPILTNNLIKPSSAQIVNARDYFTEILSIRKDSSLFRLKTGQEVQDRLSFYNVGANQVPGLVVMAINGSAPSLLPDAKYKSVVVLFNVDKVAKSVTIDALKGKSLRIHPVQQNSQIDLLPKTASYSSGNGSFTIPARSTVVFVE
jgi:pullulanase-type alpha-1,6-glucosidase